MKKRVLMILSTGLLTGLMLVGCGNNAEPASADDGGNIPANNPSATEMPVDVGPASEPAGESMPESTEGSSPEMTMNWFKDQGLKVTPQGDFTFRTMARDANLLDLDTFEVKANAVISETTIGVEDGYKQVKLTLTEDVSALNDLTGNSGFIDWYSAYDRFSGTSFEFDATVTYSTVGQTAHKAGFVTIANGDVSYDVSISYDNVNEFPIVTNMITVTCPVDYNGVVFQVGYWDSERNSANQAINYAARLYTIDELPAWGDGYYYFSYTNE